MTPDDDLNAKMLPKTARSCWASILGNCEGKISREHVISLSVLPKKDPVRVQGFKGFPPEGKWLTRAALTAKILCQKHNSELSPLDQAAAEAKTAFKGFYSKDRLCKKSHVKCMVYTIPALLLSRWICKTACNYMVLKGLPPDPDMVKYAFGLPTERQYYDYLNIEPRKGADIPYKDGSYGIQRIGLDKGDMVFRFILNGFPWVWANFDISTRKGAFHDKHGSIGEEHCIYRLQLMNASDGKKTLRFIWKPTQ